MHYTVECADHGTLSGSIDMKILPRPVTIAVEDSRNGILSASRAGMRVAMVPDLLPPTPELEPLLWGRFDSLLQLRDRLAKELD